MVRPIVNIFIRFVQAIIGIIGNTLTLIIIKRMKVKTNGHICMIYLAISDILVSAVVPVASATVIFENYLSRGQTWEILCYIRAFLYHSLIGGCLMCYTIVSLER